VFDNSPPAGSAYITMVLNQSNLDQSLEMVIEIVAVNIKSGLKLNGTHFITL